MSLELKDHRLPSRRLKNRRVVHARGCTTAGRWIGRKTLETENATKGEQPDEWYMSPRAADHDADGGKDSGGAKPQIVERPVPVPQVMVQDVVREAD